MIRPTIRPAAGLAPALGLLLAFPAFAAAAQDQADRETQEIKAAGLSLEIPTDWKRTPPSSRMRILEIEVPAAEGDQEPAEMAVFAFPGGAGTVQMNIARWQRQFYDEQGRNPEIETETIEAKGGADVTFVETAGRYRTSIPRPIDKPDYRLLGGILPTERFGYFIKLVGPDETVKKARPAFKAMLESMSVERD